MSEDRQPGLPHTLPEQPWRNQAQWVTTLTLFVVVGIIIGALYLIQTTTTTTTVRVLDEMSEQRGRLERNNERLRAEIANLQSLPRVMTKAAEMGFREAAPDEIQYITVQGYRYNRPQVTPTPTPAPTSAGTVYDETLSGWLHQQWDAFKRQFETWRNEQS